MLAKRYDFQDIQDITASLVVIEQKGNLPFRINRIYFSFDFKEGVSRGFHAHKSLHQIAISLRGSFRMDLDDGRSKESVVMNKPNVGIDLPPMIWHEMHEISLDCIILVLASDSYQEDDYIRDYGVFLNAVKPK